MSEIHNVICVTKRYRDEREEKEWRFNEPLFHQPITGQAQVFYTPGPGGEIVNFQGMIHKLLYRRTGLSDGAVVLAIEHLSTREVYTAWELYTDTPAEEGVRPEYLRKLAEYEIFRHRWPNKPTIDEVMAKEKEMFGK